jgi:uncharacterized protein (TIGR03546 family)
MLNFFLRPLRILAQILAGNDSPRQTAWGLALGMMVGLLPKGNLLAIGLGMLVCALSVNRAAAILALGLFSYLGAELDDFAHRLGSLVLTWPAARDAFKWLYDQPLGPWLGFNNTIVMGQLLIGLYCFYPTYLFGRLVATRIQPRIHHWLMRRRIIRWLRGAEVGAQWGFGG